MDNQRIRNLTTDRLHTEMPHIYEDIEYLLSEKGLTTHQFFPACKVLKHFIHKQVQDDRFWDNQYDTSHTGETTVVPLDTFEQAKFWEAYGKHAYKGE
jgi:hypothetical protein